MSSNSGVVAQQPYINCIRRTLEAAMCLVNFPSQVVERHNKPEVEAQSSEELVLNPIVIARDADEKVLIESMCCCFYCYYSPYVWNNKVRHRHQTKHSIPKGL